MTDMEVQSMKLHMTEFNEYVKCTPMNKEERKMLLEWVLNGNSVYENTSFSMEEDGRTPIPFLEELRMEEQIRKEIRGMSPEEIQEYLKKNFWGPRTPPDVLDDDELPF